MNTRTPELTAAALKSPPTPSGRAISLSSRRWWASSGVAGSLFRGSGLISSAASMPCTGLPSALRTRMGMITRKAMIKKAQKIWM